MNSQNRDVVEGTKSAVDESAKKANREVNAQTNQQDQSVLSSAGAIGKQFNPDGNIGQIGEKVGGPFSKEGVIGSQFDASKGGIAGQVEKLVGGPSQKPQ